MGHSWENLQKRKLLNKQIVKPGESIPFQHLPSDSPLWQKRSLCQVLRIHTVRAKGSFASHLANQSWCPLLAFLLDPRTGGIKAVHRHLLMCFSQTAWRLSAWMPLPASLSASTFFHSSSFKKCCRAVNSFKRNCCHY